MLVSVRAALIACVFFLVGAAPAWSQATADLPEGVEPMTSVVEVNLPRREDVVSDTAPRDDLLANAPEAEEGFFVVPKVVE